MLLHTRSNLCASVKGFDMFSQQYCALYLQAYFQEGEQGPISCPKCSLLTTVATLLKGNETAVSSLMNIESGMKQAYRKSGATLRCSVDGASLTESSKSSSWNTLDGLLREGRRSSEDCSANVSPAVLRNLLSRLNEAVSLLKYPCRLIFHLLPIFCGHFLLTEVMLTQFLVLFLHHCFMFPLSYMRWISSFQIYGLICDEIHLVAVWLVNYQLWDCLCCIGGKKLCKGECKRPGNSCGYSR